MGHEGACLIVENHKDFSQHNDKSYDKIKKVIFFKLGPYLKYFLVQRQESDRRTKDNEEIGNKKS